MADVLLRNLDPGLLARLRTAARAHHRSLQAEIHDRLEEADRMSLAQTRRISRQWLRRLGQGGRIFSDSTELIREDRDRR